VQFEYMMMAAGIGIAVGIMIGLLLGPGKQQEEEW
jgi:hypothetical protein